MGIKIKEKIPKKVLGDPKVDATCVGHFFVFINLLKIKNIIQYTYKLLCTCGTRQHAIKKNRCHRRVPGP